MGNAGHAAKIERQKLLGIREPAGLRANHLSRRRVGIRPALPHSTSVPPAFGFRDMLQPNIDFGWQVFEWDGDGSWTEFAAVPANPAETCESAMGVTRVAPFAFASACRSE